MKVIVSFALLGLSFAGFLSDVKKVGGFIADHQNTIEKVVNTTIEVAGALSDLSDNHLFEIIEITEEIFSDDELCYVPPSDLSDDTDSGSGAGTDYSDENPIAFFKVGDLITGAKDTAKVISDVIHKKSVSQIIEDGLKVLGDLNAKNGDTEELFSFSDALHDAGDVAGIVSAGVEVAGLFA